MFIVVKTVDGETYQSDSLTTDDFLAEIDGSVDNALEMLKKFEGMVQTAVSLDYFTIKFDGLKYNFNPQNIIYTCLVNVEPLRLELEGMKP